MSSRLKTIKLSPLANDRTPRIPLRAQCALCVIYDPRLLDIPTDSRRGHAFLHTIRATLPRKSVSFPARCRLQSIGGSAPAMVPELKSTIFDFLWAFGAPFVGICFGDWLARRDLKKVRYDYNLGISIILAIVCQGLMYLLARASYR